MIFVVASGISIIKNIVDGNWRFFRILMGYVYAEDKSIMRNNTIVIKQPYVNVIQFME